MPEENGLPSCVDPDKLSRELFKTLGFRIGYEEIQYPATFLGAKPTAGKSQFHTLAWTFVLSKSIINYRRLKWCRSLSFSLWREGAASDNGVFVKEGLVKPGQVAAVYGGVTYTPINHHRLKGFPDKITE